MRAGGRSANAGRHRPGGGWRLADLAEGAADQTASNGRWSAAQAP